MVAHARGSTAGQKRNFLGPSGRVGGLSASGHEAHGTPSARADYDSRHAPRSGVPLEKPKKLCVPGGRQGQESSELLSECCWILAVKLLQCG